MLGSIPVAIYLDDIKDALEALLEENQELMDKAYDQELGMERFYGGRVSAIHQVARRLGVELDS